MAPAYKACLTGFFAALKLCFKFRGNEVISFMLNQRRVNPPFSHSTF